MGAPLDTAPCLGKGHARRLRGGNRRWRPHQPAGEEAVTFIIWVTAQHGVIGLRIILTNPPEGEPE